MRLYHLPRSSSTRVLWLLEEIGAPYDLTILTREQKEAAEHRQRHPLGRVPVLEEDGGFVFESAALCLHLADQHPEAELIAPLGSHERALVYQWTLFAMTELQPAFSEAYRHRESDPTRAQAGAERFQAAAEAVEKTLAGQQFLVGDRFTVADLVCGSALAFAQGAGLTAGLPNITAYVERLDARPARQRANAIGT